MKQIKHLWAAVVAAALFATLSPVNAADGKKLASFIDSFTAAPVAALRTDGINGQSDFGAGIDIGVGVNKFVSIHATALTYENENWRSASVDESELYAQADLTKFWNNSVIPYVKGGGVADWNNQDFGLGVGGGVKVQFSKNVSLGGDYTLRAWFSQSSHSTKDSLLRAYLEFKL